MKNFRVGLICVALLSITLFTGARSSAPPGLYQRLDQAIRQLTTYEPTKEGPGFAAVRGASVLPNPANPGVKFQYPVDGQSVPFGFVFEMRLQNWDFRPDLATNPLTNFADGTKELQTGHLHVWIYNYDTGEQVGFLGAGSNYVRVGLGQVNTAQQKLPPGRYKAYVVLQDHDHMVPTQTRAPARPGFDAVVFTVQ